jgi:hypothetical protein
MTIHVIGKGESKEFFKHDGNITIGVNDVNKWIKTDHIVVVDPMDAYKEQHETYRSSNAMFWSQNEDNKNYVKNFTLIELARGRGVLDEFDSDRFVYSITSPFVAVHLAYKLGAKNIVMWGVDFNTHPNFDTDSLRNRALKDFGNLRKKLNERGVNFYVGNEMSMFSSILPILES